MTAIRVDYNRRGRSGFVISSTRRADGPVQPGSIVRVYQPGEPDMDLTAEVVSVNPDGRIELDINWAPAEVDELPGAKIVVRSGRSLSAFGSAAS